MSDNDPAAEAIPSAAADSPDPAPLSTMHLTSDETKAVHASEGERRDVVHIEHVDDD
jgi:hypothetical protein